MSEIFDVRILLPVHKDAVLELAKSQLERRIPDPVQRELASWSARWRPEALDHYLSLGWSYGAFDGEGHLRGFLLAQPYLFHRGLTQTLWVEVLEFTSTVAATLLLDTTYRWARDKHFQCLLMERSAELEELIPDAQKVRAVTGGLLEWRSSKF